VFTASSVELILPTEIEWTAKRYETYIGQDDHSFIR